MLAEIENVPKRNKIPDVHLPRVQQSTDSPFTLNKRKQAVKTFGQKSLKSVFLLRQPVYFEANESAFLINFREKHFGVTPKAYEQKVYQQQSY